MLATKTAPNGPFWVDDPNPNRSPRMTQPKIFGLTAILISVYRMLGYLFILFLFIALALKFPVFWIFAVIQIAIVGAILILSRSGRSRAARVALIQQLAKEKTGASYIGSALHTAGHPLLQLNQPIVLALKDSTLSIYDYASSVPIDALQLKDIQRIETVSYDSDRVPHPGVIDNTAQALQITFLWRGNSCTCLFRRMYKIRPIEWFQVVETARLTVGR